MPKVLQKMAFQLNSCYDPDVYADLLSSNKIITNLDETYIAALSTYEKALQIPFLDFDKGITFNTAEDNSILSNGFMDTPLQVGQYVEKSGSLNWWYSGLNKLLYWVFGFQNETLPVCVFTITTPTVEPTGGAVYTDVDLNSYTFLRKETTRNSTYYVFQCTTAGNAEDVCYSWEVPALSTGDLTKVSGTGDATLAFTAHSVNLFEHLFELDSHERHATAFRTAEQVNEMGFDQYTEIGGDTYLKKNRSATIGIKTAVTDLIYQNCMCKKWGFKSSAGQICTADFDFLAYDELRGDYSSDTWSPVSDFLNSALLLSHHHIQFKVGADEDNLVSYGVSDFNVGIDIPLDTIQDTSSGLHIVEPRLEGKYKIDLDATLSRYSATTFQAARDAWTTLVIAIQANSGYNLFELLIGEAKLSTAGPDSDSVEKEPIKFEVGVPSTSPWTTRLYGHTLVQDGPIVCRVRNTESHSSMYYLGVA